MNNNLRVVRKLLDSFHPPIFSYILEIRNQLKNISTILDVGCGMRSPVSYVTCDRCVGIDLNPRAIEIAKQFHTHHEYIHGDVTKLDTFFQSKSFDAVVCFDVIEHITKKDGIRLMQQMEKIARKKVIICTPNGFMHQKELDNPLQNHKSGWEVADFEQYGYTVKGILGPRFLRKEQHKHTVNRFAGFALSELMQITYSYSHPGSAAALMAVKTIEKGFSQQ